VEKILPLKPLPKDIDDSKRFRRILASLSEVGLIEPLVVFPKQGATKQYMLLDGTLRLHALKLLGRREAMCLVATEDETYTYNQKINVMTPIQEHFMIQKAIRSGVSEARIAKTLGMDVSQIRQKQHLLTGICPEAVALIRDRRVSAATIREIKRLRPTGQLEMIGLMAASNNFTLSYAKQLYIAAPESEKLDDQRPADNHGVQPEDAAKMRGELERLTRDMNVLRDDHARTMCQLIPIEGYLKALLANPRVVKFLGQRFPELLAGFRRIVEPPELAAA
jgi:hypothetical protein